jgi:hypothetical protein
MTMPDQRPVSDLFSDAISQFGTLVRKEIQLARAELSIKASQTIVGVGLLAGAAIISIPTVVLLFMGLASILVERGMKPSTADFTAGAVGLVLAFILWLIGKSQLKANQFVPTRTVGQLQRDAAAVREHV